MSCKPIPMTEQGFSLAEVLVAVLITTLFTVTSLQAVTLAVLFKIRARVASEATTRIQQDIELIKAKATDPNLLDPVQHSARCSASTYANGYAQVLQNAITTTAPQTYTVGGESYTLTRSFISSNPPNSSTFNVLRVNYQVRKGTSSSPIGSPVAQSYIEVIPNVAFQCQ